jgi:hypothetical protein
MFQEVCRQDSDVLGSRQEFASFLMCQVCDVVDYEPYISTFGPVHLEEEGRHVMVCEGVESETCLVSVESSVRSH